MSDDSSTPILEIDNVHVGYGRHDVVEGFSIKVLQGETFGLIGLNGVGKTTLIKTVLGLRTYREGSIKILGKDRNDPVSKKEIAFLPERFEPPWFLTGLEFLRFSLKLYGISLEEEKIFDSSERLGLKVDALKSRVSTYSKGMRQKLGILATLLSDCDLLILDEPMSGLDPMARTLVKEMFTEARQAGRTVFLSSHILADMNEICDRVGILNNRKLAFIGTPKELRDLGGEENLERAFLHIIEKEAA